jgi:ATP-dependent DNA helicase RecG
MTNNAMTKDELIQRLKGYEWNDFECKRAQRGVPKDAYTTVSAFANTQGGWLVFGVAEKAKNFEVVGVQDVDQVQNDFLSTLRGREKFNREIHVDAHKYDLDGKIVLAFYIPELPRHDKPVYLKGNPKESYVRRGAGDERCTPRELERFLRDAARECYDGQIVSDIPVDDFFDEETVSWFQNELLRRDPGKKEAGNLLDFLVHWNFVQERDQRLYPTRAGILLFGKSRYINRILPRPILEYRQVPAPFDGEFSDERWMDRVLYEENLFETWRGLVVRYMRIAERPFALDAATLRRVDDPPDYIAFREAAINLLVHQDYGDHRRKACIHFFTDCTRFWNPGDAFSSFEELLKTTEKEVRNPAVISAFRRIGLSDQGGTGIHAIFKNWNDLGRVPPKIENNKANKEFLLTLETRPLVSEEMRRFQKELGVRLSKEQADTLAFAVINPVVSFTDIRALTGLPYPRVKEIIAYLVHQLLLKEAGDNGFSLTDPIRTRYEKAVDQGDSVGHPEEDRDQVGTKSGLSGDQVGTKSALSRHQVEILAACRTDQAVPDLLALVGRTNRTKFRTDLLIPLIEEGLVEMTIPDKPKSSKQRYRTTEKGQGVLAALPTGNP